MSQATFTGYVRRKTTERPWAVVNDFVGSALASAMGVPTPANTLMMLPADEAGHLTLQYGQDGIQAPGVEGEQAVELDVWAATGILVLDQWLLNEDRYDNMLQIGTSPLVAIDHDGCLAGHDPKTDYPGHLERSQSLPLLRHEIAQALEETRYVSPWVARAQAVSSEEVRRIAYQLFDSKVINRYERDAIINFLRFRQRNLSEWMRRLMQASGHPLQELPLPEGA